MDRKAQRDRYRKQMSLAIGVSIGVHAAILGFLKIDVPDVDSLEPRRALQVVEIPDDWQDRGMEVIPLESALAASDAPDGAAAQAEATSARVALPDPGAAGTGATVAAIVPEAALPGLAPSEPALSMTLAVATPAEAPEIVTVRAQRGVILRAGGGGAAGDRGVDFVAASEAAREAERERGGGGLGGAGGIGTTIFGGGGDAHCPTPGLVPGLGGGGLPIGTGKGMGIIGRRAPTAGAIHRFGPGRSR